MYTKLQFQIQCHIIMNISFSMDLVWMQERYPCIKVSWSTLVTYTNKAPIFIKCVARCGSKNKH